MLFRYPDATPEELMNVDNVCIICREEMTGNGSAKKLPCNHIFHVSCLRSWFQRQQTCPTCRMDVLRNTTTGDNVRAQAQPQQPIAPGIPNIPGIPAQFFIPPNWQPFAVPQQQAQQPPQANPGQSNNNLNNNNINLNNNNNIINNNNINANNNNNNNNANIPGSNASQANRATNATTGPMPVPPFLFPPFLPYMAAPPMPTPPPDLSRLSLEELRALEGNERQHIEARLKHLRNIQTLVDAAMLQLQQYNQISNRWAPSQASTSSERANSSADATTSQASTSSASRASNSHDSLRPDSADLLSTPQEVIRQRRLQRFSQTQAPVIDSSGAVASDPTQSSSQSSDANHKNNDSNESNKNS